MLDVTSTATAIRAALALAAILLGLQYVLQPTLCDVFRQRLFRLRRRLFLLRVDGVINPDEPGYRRLMRSMNATLRFAESFSFTQMVLAQAFPPPPELVNETDDAVALASPEVRKHLLLIQREFGFEIVRHIVLRSPPLWLFLAVAIPVMLVMKLTKTGVARYLRLSRGLGARTGVKRLEALSALEDEIGQAA